MSRVLFLIPENVDGCVYHRLEIPMHNLKGFDLAQTKWLDGITDDDLKQMDLVIMSRDSGVDIVDTQIERLKKLGIPYIVDIDDYWKLNKEHLLYKYFDNTAERWVKLMQNAAAVTTTHSRLAGKIAFHNKNVFVVPNAIDSKQTQWQLHERVTGLDGPVFGWVGGAHHLPDLEIMKSCFAEIHKSNIINLALGGWSLESDIYKVYEYWMTGGAYKKYQRIKGENVYRYGMIYDLMDVCIVPLLESKFTACKSNLKLIEAGFKGRPCIVSRVAPYTDDFTDKEVLFVDTKYDWYKQILKMHNNPQMIFDYSEALKEKVKAYEIQIVNPLREELYKKIIDGK